MLVVGLAFLEGEMLNMLEYQAVVGLAFLEGEVLNMLEYQVVV
jgi:hypothetical protein